VWYDQDQILEDELPNAIKYLINEEIIKLDYFLNTSLNGIIIKIILCTSA
jgi:hypothetical protein